MCVCVYIRAVQIDRKRRQTREIDFYWYSRKTKNGRRRAKTIDKPASAQIPAYGIRSESGMVKKKKKKQRKKIILYLTQIPRRDKHAYRIRHYTRNTYLYKTACAEIIIAILYARYVTERVRFGKTSPSRQMRTPAAVRNYIKLGNCLRRVTPPR